MNNITWDDFDRFEAMNSFFLPACGEGENKATQICTAVNKLVYKWFNDGDVYDNRYFLSGWLNDISSYANWLLKYCKAYTLHGIVDVASEQEYTDLLFKLACDLLNPKVLAEAEKQPKVGTIYECDGPFKFEDHYEEDDEDEEEYDEEEY